MPGEKYISIDELYKNVAASKPELTLDKFKADMDDSKNSMRLFNNLKDNDAKGVPTKDYGEFVNTYGFNKKGAQATTPKENTPPAAGYPTGVQENMEAQMFQKENKDKEDLTDGALLTTGNFVKNAQGELVPRDPSAHRDDLLKKGADDYFEGFMKPEEKKAQPYVDAFYSAKTPYEKEHLTNAIKVFIPDWTPLPDAQWKQLQDTKSSMYLDAMMSRYKQDSLVKSFIGRGTFLGIKPENYTGGETTPEETEAYDKNGERTRNMDMDAASYASLAYLGQNASADPSKTARFFSHLGQGLSSFATEGVFNPATQDEWNQKTDDILKKNGIELQTKEQAEASTPTFGEKLANVSGTGASIILPMIAGSWGGKMMSLPELTKGLSSSPNKLYAFGGKLIGKSLETAVPLQLMNWKQSVTKTGAQSGVYSFGDMIMDRIPYKPVNMLGKVIFGLTKGIASGMAYTALEPTVKAGYEAIKNDDSFKKEFGKYNPETQDYVSQMVMMGLMGGWGGFQGTEAQKIAAQDELTKDGKKDIVDDANAIHQNNNEDKINSTVNDLANSPGQPSHEPFPVQEMHPISVSDDRAFVSRGVDKKIETTKPSTNKAYIKDFGSGEDDAKEQNSMKKDAMKKGLTTKTIQLKNKDGVVTGTRFIVTDPKHQHLGNRIYDLSVKELSGNISPDEVHELTALEGEDVVKSLQKMASQAKNEGVKQEYNAIIQKVKDKTENGNGAKNEVIDLLTQADEHQKEGKPDQALKFSQQAEIVGLKYGMKTHWDKVQLQVETANGEKVGMDKSVKSENTEPLIKAVKSGDVEATKAIAEKENLNVTQKANDKGEPTIEVKDGDKTIAKTDYNSIEDVLDEDEEDKILNVVNNIGKTGDKEVVKIQGMTDDEVAKGVQDMLKGNKSIEHEKLLDAAKKMINGKIITDKREYEAKDFNDLMNKEKNGANSLFNRKIDNGIKSNAKEGETTFNDLKKKAENSPFVKSDALKQNIEKTDIESMKSLAKDISEDKAVDRKEYERLNKSYPGEFNEELKKLGADTKPVKLSEAQKKSQLTADKKVIPEQGMTESDVDRLVSEKSENPQEIIDTYSKEKSKLQEKEDAQTTDKFIEEAIGKGGIDRESYSKFGDEKKVGMNIAKQFKKGGEKIDTIAKNASYEKNPEGDGTDIAPEDVVNYMEGKKYEPKRSPLMKDLENRFKDVTGKPLSDKSIEEIKEKSIKEMLESGEMEIHPFGLSSGSIKEPIASAKESVLHALGISNVEKLSPTLQPYAKGWNDVKGNFTELYNANLPVEDLKTQLSQKAEQLRGQGNTEAEKIQNSFAADAIQNMSEAIVTKQDADNYAKIIKQQNKFFIGGKEYYANNLKEMEALKDFKRPKTPLIRKNIQDIKNNMLLNVDHMADAMEGKSEQQRVEGSEPLKIWRGVNKALTFMAHIHTYAAPEIREQAYQLQRDVNNMLVKVRHSDMFQNAGMNKTIRDGIKSVDQEKLRTVLIDGFYKGKDWTTEELKKQQLSDNDITSYHSIKNWLRVNGQDTFKDAYKYYHKFYDMSPEKQKEYLDTHNKYLEENGGYLPAQRGEGQWAVTGFGKNPDTGVESRYFNKFKTEKEAKAETDRLTKAGYTGVSNDVSEKGFGGKAVNEKPKYYMMKPLENITQGEFKSINDFEQAVDKSDLSKDDKDKLLKALEGDNLLMSEADRKVINTILDKQGFDSGLKDRVIQSMERLKKGTYNPHFMERSKDVNGNIVHGFDNSMEGILNNVEQFNNRAIQNKSRTGAFYVYDKGKSFLDNYRHKETRKDFENFMDNINTFTVTPKGMQSFQNALYYGMLAAKPKQILLGYLHNLNTVYGDTGNEIDIINKERQHKNMPEYKEWASVMGTKAWGGSVNIAQQIIRGKPLDIKDNSLKNVITHIGSRGGLQHEFANYIDGTEASNEKWRVRAAFTGYSDLVSRLHATIIGHELGKAKGMEGQGLNEYVENFVDRNKFQWNKYNAPQLFRAIKTPETATKGQKMVGNLVNQLIRNPLTFKGFMLQDIGWNRDMMQRAENKTATAARILVPRLLMGGGLAKGVAAMSGVGISALENIWESFYGQKTDEDTRKLLVKHLGKEDGNAFADINTYGIVGHLTGTDTRGLMDAGTLVQEGFPLGDQIAGAGNSFVSSMARSLNDAILHDDYGKAAMDLPGELGNIAKAIHYYNNMVRMRDNIPGEKALYTGAGSHIVPDLSDVGRKLAGFSSIDWSNYYTTMSFKNDMVGKTFTLAMPDPESTVGKIQSEIKNNVAAAYDRGHTEKIDKYMDNPSYENFESAFGKRLLNKVQEYNHDLFNQYYITKQSMKPSDFKDSLSILNEVKKYAIGITNQDTAWMEMGDTTFTNNNFIYRAINSKAKSLQ